MRQGNLDKCFGNWFLSREGIHHILQQVRKIHLLLYQTETVMFCKTHVFHEASHETWGHNMK